MTASTKVGRITVRPQKLKGKLTGKFFVDIPESLSEDGNRRRPLFDNRKTAEAFAKQLWKQFESDRLLIGRKKPAGSSVTFFASASDWAEKQAIRVEADQKRANSHATDLARLKPVKAFFSDYAVDEISQEEVTRYQASRRRQGVSKGTINSEVSLLLSVLRSKGVERPGGIEFYRKPKVRHTVPTGDEIRRILDQLDGHRRVLVWLCGEAGLRPDEAYHAIWPWFTRDGDGHPVVRIAEHDEWSPKTDYSERSVPISEELLDAVQQLPRTSRWVFPSRLDGEAPTTGVRKALKTACTKAEIKRNGVPVVFSLKMFRKAFGSTLADNRVNRATIQDLVGHQRGSPVTEQFYIFLQDETVRAAAAHARIDASCMQLAKSGNGTATATE